MSSVAELRQVLALVQEQLNQVHTGSTTARALLDDAIRAAASTNPNHPELVVPVEFPRGDEHLVEAQALMTQATQLLDEFAGLL
ncbi:hypothetical protein D5S17_29345 [Pseudonocardiaceae bacterium YIM PH 21723]|nr:hypothetical protein D5S17_29345 [Pseudonocardiaceae bacterium YIM PH 21723]